MNFTENYELPIYEENDKLNVLVTGNETMRKIDSAMKANSDLATSNKLAHEALATVVEGQGVALDNVITKADNTAEEVQTMHTAVNKNTEDIEEMLGIKDTVQVLTENIEEMQDTVQVLTENIEEMQDMTLVHDALKRMVKTRVVELRHTSSAFEYVYRTPDTSNNVIGRLYNTVATSFTSSKIIPSDGRLLSFDLLEVSSVKTGSSLAAANIGTEISDKIISHDIKFEITDTSNIQNESKLSEVKVKIGSGINYITDTPPSGTELYAVITMQVRVSYISNEW